MHQKIILLMEDEPIIALHLKCFLESKGYCVFHTTESSEALKVINNHIPNFAILNVKLNSTRNTMLLSRLMRTHFLMKVLFITGVRQKDIFHLKDFYFGHTILYKPFSQLQLKTTLNNFLLFEQKQTLFLEGTTFVNSTACSISFPEFLHPLP